MNTTYGVISVTSEYDQPFWVRARLWLQKVMALGMECHPVLTYAAALAVAGVGMVAAVAAVALTFVVPLALLTGIL